jgi:hypothetical protein
MDEPHRSNWTDATAVAMPPCPSCGEMNRPGASPAITIVGKVYLCSVCGCEFLPVPPPV